MLAIRAVPFSGNGALVERSETPEETELRNKTYTEAFLKKWGSDMNQIFILRKDFSNILNVRGLNDLFKQGKFGELIRKLL